jgi:hypothetical protein
MWQAPSSSILLPIMCNWLFDHEILLTVLLGAVSVALIVIWRRTQRRFLLVGVFVAFTLICLVWYLASLSDQTKIILAFKEMSAGVHEKDVNRIFAHISDDFTLQGHNKAEFRKWSEGILRQEGVSEVEVWRITPRDVSREQRSAKVFLEAKPKGRMVGEGTYYRVVADFVLDPDGQWRMRTFEVFRPVGDTHDPLPIPF